MEKYRIYEEFNICILYNSNNVQYLEGFVIVTSSRIAYSNSLSIGLKNFSEKRNCLIIAYIENINGFVENAL